MDRFKHSIICDKWVHIIKTEHSTTQLGPSRNNGGICTCGTDTKIDIWNEALNEAIKCVKEPTEKRYPMDVRKVVEERIIKLKQEK